MLYFFRILCFYNKTIRQRIKLCFIPGGNSHTRLLPFGKYHFILALYCLYGWLPNGQPYSQQLVRHKATLCLTICPNWQPRPHWLTIVSPLCVFGNFPTNCPAGLLPKRQSSWSGCCQQGQQTIGWWPTMWLLLIPQQLVCWGILLS